MPEPKGNDAMRTLAVRVTPDYHAQLSMVAQVDGISLTDLFMRALDNYMASRRDAPEFQAKVQAALEEAEAQMARTKAMLLGTLPEESAGDPPATSRGRRKDERVHIFEGCAISGCFGQAVSPRSGMLAGS